ncbi:MAG TPA: phosphotransferase family protein [Candidatus Dormibacteraeota bacterium]|nr:phosphotransferase family protein [Candidatus Dormibacteraeota bacterium]
MTSGDFDGLLDLGRLEQWMSSRLGGSAPIDVMRITSGASNEMFEVSRSGEVVILRRPPSSRAARSAHDVVREHRVLIALAGSDVPHPRPIALCEDEAVIGAPFYLMERIDGFAPREPLPSPFDRDPAVRHAMGIELVDVLARIACVDWKAAGLEGFGRPEGFLERQVGRWLGQLETYRTRDIPGLDGVARWLTDSRPEPSPPGIIHGDYQFINVMFAHGTPPRIAAVVDWEQSTIGDPLLDLGWVLAGWTDPGEAVLYGAYLSDRSGLPTRAELIARYAERTGRSTEHIGYYVVLSLFKLACVLEGSYYRYVKGMSRTPAHRRFGELVPQLISRAAQLATAPPA